MTEPQTRYSTLRDYALLRRQKWLVIACAVAFGGAAYALSASQEAEYQATASTQFNDIARDAWIAGNVELPIETGLLVVASVQAEKATSLETARKAQKRLEVDISPEHLRSAISTRVAAQTIFVEITATWDDPEFAARLANAFAAVTVDQANADLDSVLQAAIAILKGKAKQPLKIDDVGNIDLGVLQARQQLQSLNSLKTLLDEGALAPAEIARRAEVPSGAASPRTSRNTLLGLVVGLALGLLAAFARDLLDRRIRTSKDAHDEFGLPVLARVGVAAMGSTGIAAQGNGRTTVGPADVESFRILRTNVAALDPQRATRSVLVTSGLPQEGKSTVAASLAAASAAAGQRTLLVDADLRRPVLATRLGLPESPGLCEYLAGEVGPKDVLQTVSVRTGAHRNGDAADDEDQRKLVCITAGNPAGEPAELLASERCHDFLEKVSRVYDLVVIDSSPLLSTAAPLELMPHVASVLICVRLDVSTRETARAVTEAVQLMPDRPTGLVVTGAKASDGYYGYYGY